MPKICPPPIELIEPGLLDAAVAELCERSLYEFVQEAWKVIEPGTEFVPSWHIRSICQHLEACTRGEIRRLIINIPPRCMKSRLVSVFWPCWVWITWPESRWLYASYSHNLSIRDSIHCRDVIASPWYQRNWGQVFKLRSDQNQKTRFDNDRAGFRMASSTGGVGTGEGGDFIIADDPHNVVEAESDAEREKVIHWWGQSMSTRGNDPRTVCHVVVMQRLHELDLTGHLLDQGGYVHLCLPMEFEADRRCATTIGWKDPREQEGQLLCSARFPKAEVAELKKRLGLYGAAGQLQQRPAPREGGFFAVEKIQMVDFAPVGLKQIVRYWDKAGSEGTGDYTAGVLMGVHDGKYWILDVVRGQWAAGRRDDNIDLAASLDATNYGGRVQIWLEQEPGSGGKQSAEISVGRLRGYRVKIENVTGPKVVRADPLASQMSVGAVSMVRGPWNRDFIDELRMFPNGAHDDQVDAASGAFRKLAKPGVRLMVGA